MVIIIGGASHSGKTFLSKKLIEKYKISCTSLDHIKMGLYAALMTVVFRQLTAMRQ